MSDFQLSAIPEIIEEARQGRMFILIDDEDRENEGDLVLPAQWVTPAAINFMATHGRGLVCLALTQDRADHLGLSPMAARNRTRHGTVFTASIEAKTGVTTGISAADRSQTIAVAVSAVSGADDIVSPGHVFPLIAREGGVLMREGHTEAAVDLARLAGLDPSGVICEIMNDDGSMARLPDLVAFAGAHGLKIGAIRDLVAYRYRHDHFLDLMAETQFDSHHGGTWRAKTYRNAIDGSEHIVLQKGEIDPQSPTLVRMHATSMLSDLFGQVGERTGLLQRSMEIVGEAGAGLVVILRDPTPPSQTGLSRASPGPSVRSRDHGVGARILADLGVRRVRLLTNARGPSVSAAGYGIEIVERVPLPKAPRNSETRASAT